MHKIIYSTLPSYLMRLADSAFFRDSAPYIACFCSCCSCFCCCLVTESQTLFKLLAVLRVTGIIPEKLLLEAIALSCLKHANTKSERLLEGSYCHAWTKWEERFIQSSHGGSSISKLLNDTSFLNRRSAAKMQDLRKKYTLLGSVGWGSARAGMVNGSMVST